MKLKIMKLLTKSIPPSGKTHSATVIFFHGSGKLNLFLELYAKNKFTKLINLFIR